MAFRARSRRRPATTPAECALRPSPPYRREVNSRSSGAFPSTLESSRSRSQRPTFTRHTLARMRTTAGFDFHRDRFPILPDGRLHGQLADVGLEVFFLLPSVPIQPLAEISLAVEQPDTDQRNVEIGSTLDVIAGEDSQAARINGDRLMQTKFGGEIRDWPRPQHSRMLGAPCPIRLQIFLLAAIGVVDAPMQHQFRARGAQCAPAGGPQAAKWGCG